MINIINILGLCCLGIRATKSQNISNLFFRIMRISSKIPFLLLLSTASCNIDESKKYTTKYDNVDLEEIIKSDRLLKNYVDCLLEKRPCTPDGLELRSKLES